MEEKIFRTSHCNEDLYHLMFAFPPWFWRGKAIPKVLFKSFELKEGLSAQSDFYILRKRIQGPQQDMRH